MLQTADSVLNQYEKGIVPESIRGQAVLSVLKNITQRKEWFDVCSVNHLAKMNEITFSEEHEELFHSLHCIYWNEMTQETREYLMATLIDYFRGNLVMSNAK